MKRTSLVREKGGAPDKKKSSEKVLSDHRGPSRLALLKLPFVTPSTRDSRGFVGRGENTIFKDGQSLGLRGGWAPVHSGRREGEIKKYRPKKPSSLYLER